MDIDTAIYILLKQEKDLECKLDLLTSISITTSSEEVFDSCERIRASIVEESERNDSMDGDETEICKDETRESEAG